MDINDLSVGHTVIINCDIINDGLYASLYNNEVCTVTDIDKQFRTVYLTNDRIANNSNIGDGTIGVDLKWIRAANIYEECEIEDSDVLLL